MFNKMVKNVEQNNPNGFLCAKLPWKFSHSICSSDKKICLNVDINFDSYCCFAPSNIANKIFICHSMIFYWQNCKSKQGTGKLFNQSNPFAATLKYFICFIVFSSSGFNVCTKNSKKKLWKHSSKRKSWQEFLESKIYRIYFQSRKIVRKFPSRS